MLQERMSNDHVNAVIDDRDCTGAELSDVTVYLL